MAQLYMCMIFGLSLRFIVIFRNVYFWVISKLIAVELLGRLIYSFWEVLGGGVLTNFSDARRVAFQLRANSFATIAFMRCLSVRMISNNL